MKLEDCNPFIRAAEIQPAILEGTGLRKAYDHRLFYILENSGSIQIEQNTYDIRPDTLILIPPAVPYDFRGKLKTCVLNFDMTRRFSHRSKPQFPPAAREFDPRLLFDTETAEEFSVPCVRQGDISVREDVLRIFSQFHTQGKYSQASVCAMLKLLLCRLVEQDISHEDRLCERIMSYIRLHAATISENEEVAKHFGYHSVYLSELLKRVTGKTLHTAIVDEKLRLACRWLVYSDIPIADVAEMAGFCSRTHFSTVFTKKMGISPKAWRDGKRNAPQTAAGPGRREEYNNV